MPCVICEESRKSRDRSPGMLLCYDDKREDGYIGTTEETHRSDVKGLHMRKL